MRLLFMNYFDESDLTQNLTFWSLNSDIALYL